MDKHTYLSLISKRHIKESRENSGFLVLNCRGHNSNFRVVQVETVQEISQACRPLSQQTSESLYKKAENELLIFRFSFSPLTFLFPSGIVML